MTPIVLVAGLLAEGIAWWLVAFRHRDIWATMTPVLVVLGVAALFSGVPALAEEVAPVTAVAAGLVAGVGLYLATRVFMFLFGMRWPLFRTHSVRMYLRQERLPLASTLLLSVGLMVVGEELFYRGWFQPELERAFGGGAWALVVAWIAFVAANVPSWNLAIVAGAIVGGVAWVGLAAWSGGMLASLACHAIWTALMLSFPAVRPELEEGVA